MKSRVASRFTLSLLLFALVNGCSTNHPATTAEGSAPTPVPTQEAKMDIPGPIPGTRLDPAYVTQVGRTLYFWAWPMVNIYNRKITFEALPGSAYLGGLLPVAPPNQLTMLTDYIKPEERAVACPNQDVVYGLGILDFTKEPVVVQVPDFKDRFWVYQVVDGRTDSFAKLGKMYDTKPGFYLLTGPDWNGTVPNGITGVFHAKTKIGVVIPRVFKTSTPEDTAAVQPIVSQITMYPLSKFNNRMVTTDWTKTPIIPSPAGAGAEETKWVVPDKFFDQLGEVLDENPPLPGEEQFYANARYLLDAAQKDPKVTAALVAAANDAEKNLVTPLFQFRNYGLPLPNNWTTQKNGADFGTDYYTRTAVGKSNIFVNTQNETKYFYQDLDSAGARLNGAHSYTVTFPAGLLPPVKGFWSLTMYNEHHFFEPNKLVRYSLGTKNKDLQKGADGSLTIYVSTAPPNVIGMFTDFYQRTLTDVGAAGPDLARGGLYLLLPPDYEGPHPGGYHTFQSRTYNVFLFFRTVLAKGPNGPDPTKAVELAEMTRVYPLASREQDRPAMKFPNASPTHVNMMYPVDFSYWEKLKKFVDYEPVGALDMDIRGMLASFGIVKGQPFNPNPLSRDILSRAVVEAPKQLFAFRMNTATLDSLHYYKDRQYVNVWAGVDADWNTPTYQAIDQRAAYFQTAYSSAPAMVNDTVGQGSKYPVTFKDADGDFLDGGKSYKVHLPPNIPAALYWAVTAYNPLDGTMPQTSQPFPSRNGFDKVQVNADTSVDLYFGPTKPAAAPDENWIQTLTGHGLLIAVRLYGAGAAFYDQAWKPDDPVKI